MLTSASQKDNDYLDVVRLALENPMVFRDFRRMSGYIGIVEHSEDVYRAAEKRLHAEHPEMWQYLDKIATVDYVGNPIKYESRHKAGFWCSAKVMKVALVLADIMSFVGDRLDRMFVTEIGCGFGAQFKAINDLFRTDYLFVDLARVNKLIRKCVEAWHACGWAHGKLHQFIDAEAVNDYGDQHSDLFISNYGISECNRELQEIYIKKFCVTSRFGFVLYNKVTGVNAMTAIEFAEMVPGSKVWPRSEYDDGQGVNLITWGKKWKR